MIRLGALSGLLAVMTLGCGGGNTADKTPATAASGGSDGTSGGTGGGTGGTDVGTGGTNVQQPPPPKVNDCNGLPEVGKWEEITPPELLTDSNPTSFVVDPVNQGTVYLGSNKKGIWKTTDCGASWVQINVGTDSPICGNGDKLCSFVVGTGMQWTFVIDPIDTDVLYTNNGYGWYNNGIMKSTNGGVDWREVWPPVAPLPDGVVAPQFVGDLRLDPDDHEHMVLSFHAPCQLNGQDQGCIAESTDGGESWRVLFGNPRWGSENTVYILNSTTWLVPDKGLQLTTDRGATWRTVSDKEAGGHTAGQLYKTKDGVFYLGNEYGILRSENGIDWNSVPNSGTKVVGIIGDGDTMFASQFVTCFDFADNLQPYLTSPEADGLTWTTMPSPSSPDIKQGGELDYDKSHNILYSSNCQSGFWRVVTK